MPVEDVMKTFQNLFMAGTQSCFSVPSINALKGAYNEQRKQHSTICCFADCNMRFSERDTHGVTYDCCCFCSKKRLLVKKN